MVKAFDSRSQFIKFFPSLRVPSGLFLTPILVFLFVTQRGLALFVFG